MKHPISLLLFIFLINLLQAEWQSDPSAPQLIGSGIQPQVVMTSDGGTYISWLTDGDYHVYIQYLNELGDIQFEESGLLISANNNASWIAINHLNLSVDSENNAIVTTVDERTGNWEVYAWKISQEGNMLWGNEGIALTNNGSTNMSPRLTILEDNSVVVSCTYSDSKVFLQRISSDGQTLWGDGVVIEDDNNAMVSPNPVKTVDNNIMVQWIRQASGWPIYSELLMQKFDQDGISIWNEATTIVGPTVFPMGNWSQQLVCHENGESSSAWTQFSGNVQNAVAQNTSAEGILAWGGEVDLSLNSSNFRMSPKVTITEDAQELVAVWKETNGSQSQRGISAQRLNSEGERLWSSTGMPVVPLNSNYDYLDISIAGYGEEIISTYLQQSSDMSSDIYANRLDSEGNVLWEGESVTITNSNDSKSDMMTGTGENFLIISWSENGFVYAHCLREDGTLGAPDIGSSNCTADDGTEGVDFWGECYSIENTDSLDLSDSGLSNIIDSIPPEIGNLTNLTYLNLEDNELTCSIPPEIGNLTNLTYLDLGRNELAGSIPLEVGNLTNLATLYLNENQLTGSIPSEIGNLTNLEVLSLSSNQLSGIIPDEICNQGDSSPSLSNNQLCPPYPSCIQDYVGEQDTTNCEQVSIIKDITPGQFTLFDPYPNPFNPVTSIRYQITKQMMVSVSINDMMGKKVRTIQRKIEGPGKKIVQWNGTNDYGESVSSGIYLVKIESGILTDTKKLILLK